jgi:hypothetical protein
LTFDTPEAATQDGWVERAMSTTISGLAVAPGGYLYLRWSSDDAGGSGSRDECGLDDVQLSANL